MIRVAILGSTGSIGRSALEVIRRHPARFEVVALAANRSVDLLARQVPRETIEPVEVRPDEPFERFVCVSYGRPPRLIARQRLLPCMRTAEKASATMWET